MATGKLYQQMLKNGQSFTRKQDICIDLNELSCNIFSPITRIAVLTKQWMNLVDTTIDK